MQHKIVKNISMFNIIATLLALVSPFLFAQNVEAAPNLNQAMVRLDRMQGGVTTTGTVCARPTSTATEGKVLVTFPAGFTVGASFTSGVVTTGWPGSPIPTAWPSIQVAGSGSGQTVTFTSGDLTVGTTYCFNWTNAAALTNAAAANNMIGYIETQTGASATIDKSAVAFSTITNDTISITGAVDPTFSFSLPTNTDSFTTSLSNAAVSTTTGSTATITTNARNGWTSWVKSANAGLISASPGATTIATVGSYPTITTLSAGTNGYLLKVATSGGSSAPATGYTTAGVADGGALSTSFQIAAASSAAAAANTVTFTERAWVSSTQAPATDYTDTLTIIAAGQF